MRTRADTGDTMDEAAIARQTDRLYNQSTREHRRPPCTRCGEGWGGGLLFLQTGDHWQAARCDVCLGPTHYRDDGPMPLEVAAGSAWLRFTETPIGKEWAVFRKLSQGDPGWATMKTHFWDFTFWRMKAVDYGRHHPIDPAYVDRCHAVPQGA